MPLHIRLERAAKGRSCFVQQTLMQLQAMHSLLIRSWSVADNVQPAVATPAQLTDGRQTAAPSRLSNGKMLPPRWVWPTTARAAVASNSNAACTSGD